MENPLQLKILLSGRIFEETEVFKLVEEVISCFKKLARCEFFFLNEKTYTKIREVETDDIYYIFESKHREIIDFVVTIGGDGTILYTAK